MTKLTHHLIKKTAIEIAGAAYEELAADDVFYKQWPSQEQFMRKQWKTFLGPARETLVRMLTMDYPEAVKEEIFRSLCMERALPGGDVTSVARH